MNSRFDLEKALAAWRRSLEYNRAFSADDLDELEQHVRDQVAGLVAEGLTEEAAFHRALHEMGDYPTAEAEYRKVYWGKLRREHRLNDEISWRGAMLKNYFLVGIRSLLRAKLHSFLNLFGLAVGMACCLLIFQYAAYETSFDAFHEKKDQLYRATFRQTQNGEDQGFGVTVGYIFGPTMAQEVPGIVRYSRVHPFDREPVLSYNGVSADQTFTEDKILFVDSTFLSMFNYRLVNGDRATALRQPQTMLVSESMARKYFRAEEPVGKAVKVTGFWVRGTYTVAGVFKDVPPTSHMQFDFLLPMEDLLRDGRFDRGGGPWGWQNFVTYLEIEPTADVAAIEANITKMYSKHRRDEFTASNTQATAYLQPLMDIHLNSAIRGPVAVTGDRNTVYFFSIIGLITLVVALVNYINLATARAMDRAKEVGVRKIVGAQKTQLIGQFLMESALTNIVALVLAIVLSLLLLPVVNRSADVEMTRDLWLDGRFWVVFLGIFAVGTLLSGLYPAFVLSSFKPVTVLKGSVRAFASTMRLREVLVVVQFTASIALLAGTVIVYSQISYMRSFDTGLDLEQVLVVEGPRVRAAGGDRGAEMMLFKNELRKIPKIQEVGLSQTTPGQTFYFSIPVYQATSNPSTGALARLTLIDEDFPKVYGLELAAGEAFDEGMTVPDSGAAPVMMNETMVRELGFASNEEAINERIASGSGGPGFLVKGVFKDFQWSSAHREAESVIFLYNRNGDNISMKLGTAEMPKTIAAIEQTYEELFPGNPFNYSFADASFDEQYRADRRFATLFGAFAGIAIMIACLGLFGLASFTAAQRTKEIGVRKVLGASVRSIVGLLSKEFLMLVGIAFIAAVPASFFYMKSWLNDFAYRIELGPGVFLLAGGAALFIALATVGYQAFRAAMTDPIKSLRYE